MKQKRFTEQELLEGLEAASAHADELAEPLNDSVVRYERPLDSVWDEYFDSGEGVTDGFIEDRDQPS